jgi:SAM-dependent methyltransferase
MKKEHLKYLQCPECGKSLSIESSSETESNRIHEGTLICRACGRTFPVKGGVPRFVPSDNYATGFGLQWNRHAATQLDSHTGLPLTRDRFFKATGWPKQMTGETILEVGCGAGRFTEQVTQTGAMVVSLDYSSSVDANYQSNGHRDNVLIIQADAYKMPLAKASFDRVFCLGVLQHTPDVRKTFLELPKYLKVKGSLAVDVYRRFPWWKQWTITKYWIRPFTRKMDPQRLYMFVERYVYFMWPICRWINRLPYGRNLNWKLLVADYRGLYPLEERLLRDWAVLDTFDMLAPAFDQPQTLSVLQGWFEEAGLLEVEFGYGLNGFEGRGRRLS